MSGERVYIDERYASTANHSICRVYHDHDRSSFCRFALRVPGGLRPCRVAYRLGEVAELALRFRQCILLSSEKSRLLYVLAV